MLSNDVLFQKHPDPMWIYDRHTLNFLEVNEAAIASYGYSREEFLKLTIADIRPSEDVAALHAMVSNEPRGLSESSAWRHRVKSGRIIFVSIRSNDLDFDKKKARMVSATNVTSLINGEIDRAASVAGQRELTQRLSNTLENLNDGFITFDTNLMFTFINREGEKILNTKRSNLLGKSLTEAYPDDKGRVFEEKYLRSLQTGEVVRFTEYYAPPLAKWFDIHAHPIPDGLAVYFRDVTEQRAKEDQLKLIEKAVSHLNEIVIITKGEQIDEPDGPLVVYVNDAFSRHMGYNREDLLGKTPRMLQGPNTQRDRLDAMRKSLVSWEPHRTELINYTKSGAEIWLDIEVVPVADDTGFFTHWVSVQRDITEHIRAEEIQKLHLARFDTIAKAVNDVVWEWNLITDELWWSDTIKSHFGHDPTEMEKDLNSWKGLIHPDDKERVVAKNEAGVKKKLDKWEDEYRFARADGTYAIVVGRGHVIHNSADTDIRMIGTLTDVTERREYDMRLRRSQKLAALGKLTGGIAHDFNNLLTVIIGNAEILAERVEAGTDLNALAKLTLAAAERGAELTGRLLAFGRQQLLEPKLVDVSLLIHSLELLLVRTLPESIELKIISLCEPCHTLLDVGQLESALLNLVINARDAMPHGGQITILTDNVWLDSESEDVEGVPAGNFVMVSVQDSGFGMDQETLERAFEPFFTTKEAGAGSGLGLSMVYGFVRQSQGRVKISTTLGENTQIVMYFPLVNDEAEAHKNAAKKEDSPEDKIGGDEKILVVEDDDMVRTHVTSHLASLGYTIMSTSSGEEALNALQRDGDIALLFTDVIMPGGINGGLLARKARLLRPEIKILFTSGHFSDPAITNGISGEQVLFVKKPYRLADLARVVRAAIDTKSHQ